MSEEPKYIVKEGKQEGKGWLVLKVRRDRREHPYTLTDNKLEEYINTIDSKANYTSLEPEMDFLVRLRDKAILSLCHLFFKRGTENLRIKVGDIHITSVEISVTFRIGKKTHKFKTCPNCNEKNGRKTKFCKVCGFNIEKEQIQSPLQVDNVFTKNKSLESPLCKNVTDWLGKIKELGAKDGDYLFPPVKCIPKQHFWKGSSERNKIGIIRLNQILQSIDPTMTSSFFRYAGAEKYLRLGYSRDQLKEIGDWESADMPERYAKRLGISPAQIEFAKDLRRI